MKPPISLARSLSHVSTAVGTASRIPHLNYHISQRQRVKATASRIQKRASHTAVLEPSGFSVFGHRSEVSADRDDRSEPQREGLCQDSIWDYPNLTYDPSRDQSIYLKDSTPAHADTFQSLLEDDLPERTLFWLLRHPNGAAFIQTATDQDFALVFSSLDPDIIFDAFKSTLKSFQFTTSDLGDVAKHDRSILSRLRLFLPSMHEVLRRRMDSGKPMTLDICRHALKCCAAIGDKKAAVAVVENLALANSIELDLECYNHLMEVQINNLSLGSTALWGQALNQHIFDLRTKFQRPPSVRGYTLSAQDPEPVTTLRGQILQIFQTITQRRFQPSEQTFVHLITALAKSGDVAGVDSILKSVWNIDVHALDTFDEEEIEGPTFYADDHPLRPTSKLLFAIVNAYGLNKDQKKASSLLDYTSRNYAIDIPLAVWEELFTWTYANNLHKSPKRRGQGQIGDSRLNADIELLFKRVVDVPYNLRPSSRILDLLTRSFRARHLRDQCFDSVRTLEKQAVPMIERLQGMIRTAKALQRQSSLTTPGGMPSKELFTFRRDFQFAFLQALSHLTMFRRNLKRSLTHTEWSIGRSWQHRILPGLVNEFHAHLPLILTYKTDTGSVEMVRHFNAKESNELWMTLNQASQIWDAIASPDPAEITEKLANVPDDLAAAAMATFRATPRTYKKEFAPGVASAGSTGFNK